jgi:adenosine kinase
VLIATRGDRPVEVAIANEVRKADPTGVGDAFRAGFLTGLAWGLGQERSAQVGSMLATYVVETVGTQEYELGRGRFLERFAHAYGTQACTEIEPHLTCPRP